MGGYARSVIGSFRILGSKCQALNPEESVAANLKTRKCSWAENLTLPAENREQS